MIKAILFDMDGVVIDSEPLYEKVERKLLGQYGISIPPEDQKYFKGSTEMQFYDLVEKKYGPQWNRQEVVKKGRRLLKEVFSREVTFVPGFVSLMERIGNRYLAGLVTSTPRLLFEEVRKTLSLERFFKEVICADDISNGKPHPEPYQTMMKRLSVSPEETLVIEDSLHGIASAKASGATCVALASSFSRRELRQADAVIESLDEIDDNLLSDLALRGK